ncbi:hypothetical protein PRZ48_000161 [Zasmidium cellare]|uniref:Uncharacterized protein n=1 Tax=Zasmidium cellare TaxID=395010 RepID=A0ABR0EYG7_ZASCE|nr:hypothetical protein PRZ48_000161 [Zasmidium cellare]
MYVRPDQLVIPDCEIKGLNHYLLSFMVTRFGALSLEKNAFVEGLRDPTVMASGLQLNIDYVCRQEPDARMTGRYVLVDMRRLWTDRELFPSLYDEPNLHRGMRSLNFAELQGFAQQNRPVIQTLTNQGIQAPRSLLTIGNKYFDARNQAVATLAQRLIERLDGIDLGLPVPIAINLPQGFADNISAELQTAYHSLIQAGFGAGDVRLEFAEAAEAMGIAVRPPPPSPSPPPPPPPPPEKTPEPAETTPIKTEVPSESRKQKVLMFQRADLFASIDRNPRLKAAAEADFDFRTARYSLDTYDILEKEWQEALTTIKDFVKQWNKENPVSVED